jgi:hypothetical protein
MTTSDRPDDVSATTTESVRADEPAAPEPDRERFADDRPADALSAPTDDSDALSAPSDNGADALSAQTDNAADALSAPTDDAAEESADEGAATPEPAPAQSEGQAAEQSHEHLLPSDVGMDFSARWQAIQQGFVDDPRTAVADADKLVGDVLQRLSSTFDEQHKALEHQWSDGEPDTEDLRTALRRYRDFFERLLTI